MKRNPLCDRCGQECDPSMDPSYRPLELSVSTSQSDYSRRRGEHRPDLCGNCSKSFEAWWKDGGGSISPIWEK